MAGLHFPITADNSSFMRALHEVSAGVRDASRQIEADGNNIDKTISRIKTGIASIGAGWGFKEVASAIANTRGEFQQLDVAFKTMLGSEEKAATLMSQLVRTAAITPFDLQGVANGAKQLLAYGVSADEVNKRLTQLGDIASGLSIPLNDLVYLYGTTITQGKMFTQDLRQFQGRGIPIADELAKQFGVAKEKVGELVTAGKVGSKEFIAAIDAMTGPGSKFGGLMEEQSKTITGQISNIEDAFDTMLNEIGKSSEGLINTTLDVTSSLVENWQTVLAILGDIAAAYGVQKAVLAGASAVATASFNAEAKALAALLPAKQESVHLDIAEAVSKGKITEATAAKVIAMRKEVQSYLEELSAQKAAATTEATLAAQRYRIALQQSIASKAAIETKRQELIASGEICGAYISENAIKEMGIVTDKAKQASLDSLAAKQEYNAAISKKKAAAEALDTASTNVNTTSQTLNARSTNILTIAKEGLVKTTKKLYATMMANPYALITAAALALGYGIYKLITYQSEEEKRANAISEAHAKCMTEYAREKKALTDLARTLESAKKGSNEWKTAKDSIVSQYGQYFKNLDAEIEKVGNLSTSYGILTREIKKSVVANQLKDFDEKEENKVDIAKTLKNSMERISSGYLVYDPTTKKNKRTVASKDLQLQWQGQLADYLMNAGEGELDPRLVNALKNQKSTWYGGHHSVWDEVLENVKDIKNNNADKEKIANSMGLTLKEVLGQETFDTGTIKNLQNAYSEAAEAYKKATVKVAEMKKNRSAYTEAQWTEAQEKLKSAKDTYEKLGGTTKEQKGMTAAQLESKKDSSHQKLLDLMKQQAEERLMLQQEYEMELWQNRINLMEDGEAKVLEQMKLDQTKEKYSLEERKKQAIQAEIQRQKAVFDAREEEKAAGNKKYAKQVFNPGEDIAKTVEKLSGIDDAIIKAQEELDKLIETEGSQEEIDKCKQRLKDLTEEHKKFSSKMGDVTDSEVRTILERYKALYEDLGKIQEKSYDDRIKNAEDSLNQYLAKYGSYEQKRYAIAKEWDEKIEQATAAERPMLEAEKDAAMSDLDFEEWKKSGEIAKAFGDIKKLSSSTVKELILHMEQYRGKIIETFDPEKIREYNEALEELKRADIDESLGIFSSFVPEPFKEAAEQEKMMVEYEKQYVELKEKAAALQSDIMANQADVVQLGKQKGVDISFDDIMGEDAFANVAAKFKEAGVEMGAEMESSLSSLVGKMGQMGNMQGMMGQLSGMMSGGGGGGGMMGNLNAVGAIVHGINDNVQSLKELFDDLSNTADALGADTSVGSNWAQAGIIMDGFAEASQGATDAFDSLKSGNVMGVIQGIVKSFTSWIRAFAAFNDAKHERKILELQDRIDDLKESYEDLGKTVDDYFSIDAADILEKQNELIRQQNALVRQQMQEEEAKKNTDDEKMEEYRKQLKANEDLLKENEKKAKEAIIGKDIKSAIGEFASLYAEAWDDGTDAAQKSMKAVKSIITSALNELLNKRLQPAAQKFYDKLAEMLKKGYLTDSDLSYLDSLKAEMDALAAKEEEQYKKIQERYKDLDELREELTDISFDSVRDNFKSLLTDMESSTEDFADNFSEMLRNALVEGLMDSKYDALLKEWYAAFAEAMDDQKLTDEERERLRQQYDAIVQQGIADRNAINDIVGGGAYSQQASKGEAWGMSQETGEELNGRFTAMVELEATNNVLVADGNAIAREILIAVRSMTGMSMTTSGSDNKDTLLAIKDMVFLSTGYLEDIAKYSKSLVEINTEIINIKNHIKDL